MKTFSVAAVVMFTLTGLNWAVGAEPFRLELGVDEQARLTPITIVDEQARLTPITIQPAGNLGSESSDLGSESYDEGDAPSDDQSESSSSEHERTFAGSFRIFGKRRLLPGLIKRKSFPNSFHELCGGQRIASSDGDCESCDSEPRAIAIDNGLQIKSICSCEGSHHGSCATCRGPAGPRLGGGALLRGLSIGLGNLCAGRLSYDSYLDPGCHSTCGWYNSTVMGRSPLRCNRSCWYQAPKEWALFDCIPLRPCGCENYYSHSCLSGSCDCNSSSGCNGGYRHVSYCSGCGYDAGDSNILEQIPKTDSTDSEDTVPPAPPVEEADLESTDESVISSKKTGNSSTDRKKSARRRHTVEKVSYVVPADRSGGAENPPAADGAVDDLSTTVHLQPPQPSKPRRTKVIRPSRWLPKRDAVRFIDLSATK